eukprot:875109-Rhodomonas_salina.1
MPLARVELTEQEGDRIASEASGLFSPSSLLAGGQVTHVPKATPRHVTVSGEDTAGGGGKGGANSFPHEAAVVCFRGQQCYFEGDATTQCDTCLLYTSDAADDM